LAKQPKTIAGWLYERRAMASWIFGWLACTLASLSVFAQQKSAAIDPDEIYWIGSAYYYHLAFQRRDWAHSDWKLLPARENPPIAKYAFGFGLALAGQRIVSPDMLGCFRVMFKDTPGAWGVGEDYAKRATAAGRMNAQLCQQALGGPGVTRPGALLRLSRHVSLASMVLASLLVLFFGASIANHATGLLASQLLLAHPLSVFAYNHAMADAVALLLSVSAALAGWHWFQRLAATDPVTRGSAALFVVLNGVLLGLACGAKLNSFIVVFLFGVTVSGAAIMAWRKGDRKRAALALGSGGAALSVAFGVFVLLNPAILADFSGGLAAVVQEPHRGLEITMQVMPEIRLATLAARFSAMTHVATSPLTFALGAVVFLIAAVRSRRAGVWFVTCWWVIAVVSVTVWIPIAWGRYVLPIVAPSVILLAYAAVAAASALITAFRRLSPPAGTTEDLSARKSVQT